MSTLFKSFSFEDFQSIAKDLQDGIIVSKIPELGIIYSNQAMENISGYSNSRLMEMDLGQLFAKLELFPIQQVIDGLNNTENEFEKQVTYLTRNKQYRIIDLKVVQYTEQDNNFLIIHFKPVYLRSNYQRLLEVNQALRQSHQVLEDHHNIEISKITEKICKTLQSSESMVWMGILDFDNINHIRPIASAGPVEDIFEGMNQLEIDTSNISTVIEYGEALIIEDINKDSKSSLWTIIADEFQLKSILLLPLTTNELTFGILSLFSSEEFAYSSDIVNEFQHFSNRLSDVIVYHLFEDDGERIEFQRDTIRTLIHDINNLMTRFQAKIMKLQNSDSIMDQITNDMKKFSDNMELLREGKYQSYFDQNITDTQDIIDENGKIIVIVDDDRGSRELVCSILNNLEYTILEAKDGEEALEIVDQYHEQISLIISDIMMPKFSGIELAEKVRKKFNINFCFISGYQISPFVQDQLESSNSPFISKPFKPSSFLEKITSVLESIDD